MNIFKNFLYVLKRFKVSSLLNLLGLSAAFAAFIVIITQVNFEYSFDKCHKNADRIYRVDNVTKGIFGIIQPRPLVETFFSSSPQIEYGAVLMPYLGEMYFTTTHNGTKTGHKTNIIICSPDITRIFSYKMVEGSSDCLNDPQNVLIPQSLAHELFGKDSALGQSLSYQSKIWTKESHLNLIVGGVYKDFPDNTQLNNCIYTAIDKDADMDSWGSNFIAYVLLKGNTNADKVAENFNKNFDFEKVGYESGMAMKLTPLTSIYLKNEAQDNLIIKSGNPSTPKTLLAIAILIIVIAVINHINFNMALAPRRIKNINTRKVLGESVLLLRAKIILEGILMSVFAYFIAVGLIYLIHEGRLLSFIEIDINPFNNMKTVFITGLIAVATGFTSAVRPAFYLTSHLPSIVLNGNFGLSKKGQTVRNVLIGFQFLVSVILITVSIFIYKQNHFMQAYSLGFDKEQVAIVKLDTKFVKEHKMDYENRLKDNPSIIDVAYAAEKFGASDEYHQESLTVGDQRHSFFYISVSWNFLDVMGIPVVEGDKPILSDETKWYSIRSKEERSEALNENRRKLIINRKLSDELGVELNSYVNHFGDDVQITGITDNVSFTSLRQQTRNAAFVINDPSPRNCSYVKIKAGADIQEVVAYIEKTISGLESTYPVSVEFYDEVFNNLYQKELASERIIGSFSLLAIIISIVGVFGLVMFECEYRKKEIGIRKVLGSYNKEILLLFNSLYLKIFAVCFVLAIPIAFYITGRWLDNFAYRTEISWWVFLLSGSVILLIIGLTVTWQSYRAATANPVESLKSE